MKKLNPKNCLTRFLVLSVAVVFVVSGYGVPVLALSRKDRKAILSTTPFYDPEDELCDVGGPAGNGPLYGPAFPKVADTAALAVKIKEYIQSVEPASGLINYSADFVKYGKQYNVNPVLLVLVGQRESQLGTDGHDGNPPKHNFWGNNSGRTSYPNYTAAIEGYFNNLRTNTAYAKVWAKGDAATVEEIIYIATPSADPRNDTVGYAKFVASVMHKIMDGIATDGTVEATVVPANACGKVNSAGAYGWDIEGPNAMVSYEQSDKRWGDKPYGEGLDSISESGCGPSALAMIGATLLGDSSITPLTLANQYGTRFHTPGAGSAWGIIPAFATDYNLKMVDIGTDFQAAASTIKAGGLVLISVDPGWFTTYGHFMVVRSVTADGSGFFMNDSAGAGRNKDSETRAFTAEFLVNEGSIKKMWSFSK